MDNQSQSQIERISLFSFPSNHLINVQLVRDTSTNKATKPEYFFFVTLAPGASSSENMSGRTYEFKQSVTIKYAVHEMASLAFAMKQYAMGNGKHINYAKFSKSDTGQKTISLAESTKTQNTKNGEINIRLVLFKVTVNGNTQAVSMTLDQAFGFGEVIDLLFKKGAELEFSRQQSTVSYQSSQSDNYRNTNKSTFASSSPQSNDNNGDDDNSSFLSFGGGSYDNPFG